MNILPISLADLESPGFIAQIGFVGENECTQVVINCSDVFVEYPTALPSLTVKAPNHCEPYPSIVERNDFSVVWTVTNANLAEEGVGEFQLTFTVSNVVKKSYTAKYRVKKSLMPTGTIPDPLDDFITRAGALISEIDQIIADTIVATVPEWARQTVKPDYTAEEVGALPEDTFIPEKVSDLIDDSGHYIKPTNGIPYSDLEYGIYQDINEKANKPQNPVNGHLVTMDVVGNLTDSGKYPFDYILATQRGAVNGVAELDPNGKVPSSQLPSFVDDVVEYASASVLPRPGETGKIYVTKDTNSTYRWSGSTYVEIGSSLALGETSSTAYRGDRGATAYSHATDASRVRTARLNGFFKIGATEEGHVSSLIPVTKQDIENLGIPGDVSDKADKADTVLDTTLSRGRKANTTVGEASFAFGTYVEASGSISHAEGSRTVASGTISHAEGEGTLASGYDSHAEGRETTASGIYSHAEGYFSAASNRDAHAEGYSTTASGEYSHAEGAGTIASGLTSHAEGSETTASGSNSHAEGGGTVAVGTQAHAEGGGTAANGNNSHAEGGETTASGGNSHAEGGGTTASGSQSHAEGAGTTASGSSSHAEGGGTVANGQNSHVEGAYTIAEGANSHVGGMYNIADSYANWPEWVSGTEYSVGDKVKVTSGNIVNGYVCEIANSDSAFTSSKWIHQNGIMNYAEIIGNGTGINARSNAYALDWDGTGRFAGDVYVNCNPDSTGGTKLATVDDIANNKDVFLVTITSEEVSGETVYHADKTFAQIKEAVLAGMEVIAVERIFGVTDYHNYLRLEHAATSNDYPNTEILMFTVEVLGRSVTYSIYSDEVVRLSEESIIDDTAGIEDTDRVWSADKLASKFSVLEPAATSSDVGKFLKAKTVSAGKVTEYELNSMTASDVGAIPEPENDGTNGQVLTTDGNGGRSWATVQSLPDTIPTDETAQELLTYEERNAGLTDTALAVIGLIFQNLPQDETATNILHSLTLECERLQTIYENWLSERSA